MLAIPFFTLLGNAQDDAEPASAPMGYAVQGNVEMNQTLRETEMQRAVQTARERKALKEAMAGYVQKPTDITTAEQFLSVNRPPGMPRREGDTEISPVKTSTYVPEFQTTAGRVNPSSAPSESVPMAEPPTAAIPPDEEKRGFFSFLRPKRNRPEETASDRGILPPPSDYTTPTALPVEGSATDAASATTGEAITTATVAATASTGSSDENPGFLRRLFGKGKKEASPPMPVSVPPYPEAEVSSGEAAPPLPATSSSPSPTERLEIPSAPAFQGTSSPPPR